MERASPRRTSVRTVHEFVREELRRAILTGALAGGTRLVQSELASSLDVSTTPVREALRDLATEGLIELDAHRGAVVHTPSPEEIREVYEIRKLLEPLAIERAVQRITDAQIDEIEQLQARMEDEPDPLTWIELNAVLHRLFDAAADAPRLAGILKHLRESASAHIVMSIKLWPGQVESGNKDHLELVEAARTRDVDRANEVIQRHLDYTQLTIEDRGDGLGGVLRRPE